MIQLDGAEKRYGEKLLFQAVDWQINPGDRIGLVGPNGSGKSTLLRILAGEESLDGGQVLRMKGLRCGYLPQYGLQLSGRTVLEECLSVLEDLREMERELEALARQMAGLSPGDPLYAAVADRFHRLEQEFRMRDGYAMEARAAAVLDGLGFRREDWHRRVEEFSGGWQMRIALARLLLAKPNLLLLDEPTNHLDLEARNWLEEYLSEYPFAFVVVSHDRYFLDVTVTKIVEIWNHRLHVYPGNYSRYLEEKANRVAQLEAAWKNQQQRIRHLETFINRFRYQAPKARLVQSRIKELERMEKIERVVDTPAIRFAFPQPKPSGRVVAELRNASKYYGAKCVLKDVNLLIERGDRVALVGPNGAGKSTLIRILAGLEPLSAGERILGHNVELDYFAQDQYRELPSDVRLLDDLAGLAPSATQTELRTLLGCFLFSEDDAFKTISVLSGGERNRYAIARLLLNRANFLLLDEPTNHLDMKAKEVLLEALLGYSGTLVFVSHDRYFIDRLATRVFELGGGQVRVYPGNYEDYLWRRSQVPEQVVRIQQADKHEDKRAASSAPKPRKVNPIRLRQLEQRCAEVEAEIEALERQAQGIEQELAVFKSGEQTRRLMEELRARRARLEELWAEWESVARVLEELRSR